MATTQAVLPLILHQLPELTMSDEQFFQFCRDNPEWQIERSATGDLLIMPPTGSETGEYNFELSGQLWYWAKRNGTGKGFDSSAGFRLPNGAVRSPDAAWVLKSRWESIPPDQRKGFAPLCPDFVLELRSESDSLELLQTKMQEYMENGAQLGWLIDRSEKTAYIYRPSSPVIKLSAPASLNGEPILPGFTLDLEELWSELPHQ